MKDLVYHAPSGLTLRFAEPDFGGAEQAAIVRAWQDRGHHAKYRGEFVCVFHRNHEHPELHLRQLGQQIFAAHYPGSGLAGSHEIVHGVSDEHQRQVEYLQRAGESAGFEVRREVALATKVRSDAVIYGTKVKMGVEVQRSALTAPAAKARTTKARRAGVEPVWFADTRLDPRWFGHVPGVKMNPDTSWAALPGQGSVTVASGVRLLVPRRCRDIFNSRCPRRPYGCNAWHPDHQPFPVLVDDLAEQVPAGTLVPILFRTLTGRGQVLIFSQADKAQYEAMIQGAADLPLGQHREQLRQSGRIDCKADAGSVVTSPREAAADQDALQLFDLPDATPARDASRWTR